MSSNLWMGYDMTRLVAAVLKERNPIEGLRSGESNRDEHRHATTPNKVNR
jgi:hypothetical protein